jgi:prepilin-type N-terminal cleavage/methylation domain-containing protein
MKQTGFTLLELSIVIAIIGLIAGGLVAGTSLIRAAQIRAVLTQKTEFSTAVIAFNLKYNELPGDMVNATKIWGTAAACPGDETTPSTDETTCDGDGDGEIDYYYYPGPVDS